MTTIKQSVARLFGSIVTEIDGAPEAPFSIAPGSVEEAARVLDFASEHGLVVLPWGGGTHQGIGGRVSPDVVLSTREFTEIDWRPDDLTAVVGSGVEVRHLEERLAERRQTAVLPEHPGSATIGGVVAAGVSGHRRLRFGPIRDRMLEVLVATGDGRVVRGGGQVVKNVSGYDLPRLFTGSLGSLGLITRVCLKLWPRGSAEATVDVDEVATARRAHRPLAVLEAPEGITVHLAGTEAEVDAQSAELGGARRDEAWWPPDPSGEVLVSVRVPPARLADARTELDSWATGFVMAHQVGTITAAGPSDAPLLAGLREWAEGSGGALVLLEAPHDLDLDPWGTPPASLPLQKRVKAAFDPLGIMVPGRLPGGL